jgi:hypothetical protein
MRSIFVAALAVASMLLGSLAQADGCNGVRRPLVTVEQMPVAAPVMSVEVGGN